MEVKKPESLKKGSLDAVVIIPSYNEGKGILPTLQSLAKQVDITDKKIDFGVFVTVNNTKGAIQEVLEANELTRKLVCSIINESVSDVNLNIQETQMLQSIIQSKVRFCLVDLSSGDNALEECNVGIASDIGAKVAMEFLKNDEGVVVRTDADTVLDDKFVSGAAIGMMRNPECSGAIPELIYGYDDVEGFEKATKLRKLCKILFKAYQRFYDMIETKNIGYMQRPFSGASIIVRAKALKEVGGFPHEAGGEDIILSKRIVESGGTIATANCISAETSDRVSNRIPKKSGGYSNYIQRLAKYEDGYSEFKVNSYKNYSLRRKLIALIDTANSLGLSGQEWKEYVGANFALQNDGFELSKRQIKSVYEVSCQPGYMESKISNKMVELAIDRIILNKEGYEKITLVDALQQMLLKIIEAYKKPKEERPFAFQEKELNVLSLSIIKIVSKYCKLLNETDEYSDEEVYCILSEAALILSEVMDVIVRIHQICRKQYYFEHFEPSIELLMKFGKSSDLGRECLIEIDNTVDALYALNSAIMGARILKLCLITAESSGLKNVTEEVVKQFGNAINEVKEEFDLAEELLGKLESLRKMIMKYFPSKSIVFRDLGIQLAQSENLLLNGRNELGQVFVDLSKLWGDGNCRIIYK